MKKIHFFKAYSRIGLPNNPINQSDPDFGVEDAPDFILTGKFLAKFPKAEVSEFRFPAPEEIKEDYWKILASSLSDFKTRIKKKSGAGEFRVVIGGENSVTFSSLLADLENIRNPGKTGYIQFDSHGEMNSYQSSPTKNFHGMYMRPFFGIFDIPEIEALVPEKMDKENALFIGNLNLDQMEKEFFCEKGFVNLSKEDFLKNPEGVLKKIGEFCSGFEHIHINFDVDVFDKSLVAATGIPSNNGLFADQVFPSLEVISRHPNITLDLSEVNPKKVGSQETLKIAREVILSVMPKK